MRLLMTLMFGFTCLAQNATLEPEIADIFYLLGPDKLVPLERQSAAVKGGAHGFVYANVVGGLIDHGALVRVIDNFLIADELYLDGMDVEVSTGDVRNEDAAS